MAITDSRLTHGIIGAALGDALGLPVLGASAAALAQAPVTGMQPPAGSQAAAHSRLPVGTTSGVTGLIQASLAALTTGDDPAGLMAAYHQWASGTAFSPVNGPLTTWPSVTAALAGQVPPAPDQDPGGLSRSLPMGYFLYHHYGADLSGDPAAAARLAAFVDLTNPGPANRLAAAIYVQITAALLGGMPLQAALRQGLATALARADGEPVAVDFRALTLLDAPTAAAMAAGAPTPRNVLGVALYSLSTTDDFAPAVLAAVNAGGATSTTAALVGGLAGLHYGYLRIPHKWCLLLAKYGEIAARVRTAERSGQFPRYD